MGQKELRSVGRKSDDDIATASQMPKEFRVEGRLIEVDRSISVTDSQHGKYLSYHRLAPSTKDLNRLLAIGFAFNFMRR